MGTYVKSIILIIVLGFLVTFGIKNSQTVQLSYYFQAQGWSIPLYVLIYVSMGIGVLIGMAIGLSKRMGLRRKIRPLEKENRELKERVAIGGAEDQAFVPSEES